MEALAKYHEQPILYLMDLVDVEIPSKKPNLRDKFNALLEECSALRCPTCNHEDDLCTPINLYK